MKALRGGFTLVEAIIALTLSSVLVILVGTVFLVQSEFYATQLSRTAAHDNARMITEMVASELRSLTDSAVILADSTRLAVRSPMVGAIVCAHGSGNRVSMHLPGGLSGLDTDEVSGVATVETASGRWLYHDRSWSNIHQSGGSPAVRCHSAGADTVGARPHFIDFSENTLSDGFGYKPPVGATLMLYRNVEYRIQASAMDPTTLGLYRGIYGSTITEFVTGLDASAKFQYRTGGSTYASKVTGASLGAIDAVRIVARARKRPESGGAADVTYGWAVNVHLRNSR